MNKIYFLIVFSLLMAMNANAANFWNTFDVNPSLDWTIDRYSPAAFESSYFDGGNRLRISITQDKLDRPSGQQGTFYNTHGKQIQTNVNNPTVMRGKLYIPTSWETSHRRSDIWGVLADASNAVTDYPIIGFANTTGSNPTFRVWDQDVSGGWVNLSYTINYNEWYDFIVEFTSTGYKYYINGTLVFTDNTVVAATTKLKAIIVQGYNFGHDALLPAEQSFNDDYDIYWDDVAVYPAGYNVVNLTQNTVYNTIQSAINAANAGDEIQVGAGTYTELLNINKANLTVRGNGSATTTLVTTSAGGGYGVNITANGVTFKGFNIVPPSSLTGTSKNGYTIHASNTPNVINGLTIEDILIDATSVANLQRTGVDVHGVDYAVLNNITVKGCDWGVGVALSGCTYPTLTNITTSGNAWGGIAVYVSKYLNPQRGSSNITFDFAQNNIGEFFYIEDQYSLTNSNVVVNNYSYGINNLYLTPNTGNFTAFTNSTQADALSLSASLNVKFSNKLSYCWDAGLANYWVGTGMKIQTAIDAASAGNTINVLAGTYAENVNITKSVELRGANYGISGCDTRGAESVINGAFTIGTDGITVNGFEFTGSNAQIASTSGATVRSNITIVNNYLHATTAQIPIRHGLGMGGGIGSTNWNVSNNKIEDIQYANSTAIAAFNVTNATINNNCISHTNTGFTGRRGINADGLQTATINGNSIDMGDNIPSANTNAPWIIQISMSDRDASDITIDENSISGAYYGITTLSQRNVENLTITNNIIGPVSVGIAINTGGTAPLISTPIQSSIVVEYNTISTVTPSIVGAIGSAVRLRNLHEAHANGPVSFSDVTVNNNSFSVPSGLLAVNNDVASYYLNATCNWYGSSDPFVVASKVAGNVDFVSYLTSEGGACDGVLPVNNVTKDTWYLTIQSAIDATSTTNGDVITVAAGTYAEDLIVNKSLDIRGPNYGINPNTGTRVAEAIIVPATSNPDINTGGQIMYLENAASGSSINGFTFNGDNPLLTSGVLMYGADVDVLEAISAYHGLSNVTISNNIVKNLNYVGIDFYNYYNSGNATTGNLIENNLFENINPSQYGIAVLIYNNCYTKIINNVMTDVRVGVQTGNFYKADPGNSRVIDNNLMNVSRRGIFHNLAYSSASEFTLSNNVISPSTNGVSTEWDGILLSSLSVPSSSLNNNITGSSTVPSQAYEIWNVKSNAPAFISGGNLSNVDYGIFANNFEGYNSNAGNGAHATVENIQINPKSIGTGIYLHDNPSSTHANVQVTVGNGVAVENCANAVVIENAKAKLVSIGDNFNLDGISGDYFKLINNAFDIDATNVNFNGKKGSAMTLAELYNVESKLAHKVDNSLLGLITIIATTDACISLNYNYASPIWIDNNSANSNATVPSLGSAPSFVANDTDFNTNNSVSFAGGTNILSIPYNNGAARLNGNTAKSFFTYFRTGDNITSRQVVFEAGGINSGYNVYIYNNRIFLGAWNQTQRRFFYIGAAKNTNYLASIEIVGGNVRVSLNGTTSGYQFFNGFSTESSENGVGGSYNRTRYMDNISPMGIVSTFTGKIAEILCYNSNTKALRDDIIDYIDAKYGTNYNSNYSGKMVAYDDLMDTYLWNEGDVEYSAIKGLSVNNFEDNIEVEYTISEAQYGKVVMYDINGQVINTIYNGMFHKGTNLFNVNKSAINSGFYFITVETNYGIESQKVIVIK